MEVDIWLGKEKTPKPEKAATAAEKETEEWAKVTISDPPPPGLSLCLSARLPPSKGERVL